MRRWGLQPHPAQAAQEAAGAAAQRNAAAEARRLDVASKPWKGDFDGMLERRAVRLYVPYTFASYNAGPGNIAKMRKEAEKRGLDPNQWFNNVEIVTAERIGIETTTCVRNIFKYYAAYRLTLEAKAASEALKQHVAPVRRE